MYYGQYYYKFSEQFVIIVFTLKLLYLNGNRYFAESDQKV